MTDDHRPHALPEIDIGDPLYRLLTRRLKLRLRDVMGLLLLNNIAQTVLIPYFHHRQQGSNLLTHANLQDVQIWLVSFISQPIILYVYWRTVEVIPAVFKSLHDNRSIRARGDMTVARFLRQLEARTTSRFYNVVVVALVVFALAMFNLIGWGQHRLQPPIGSYPYTDFEQYGLYTLYSFVRFTFVAWAVVRGLAFIDALREWWKHFEVVVNPFHPDEAGGLSAIGHTTWLSGLLVGACGLFIGSTIVVNVEAHLGVVQLVVLVMLLVLTLLIAPLAFFLPIWSTHKAMQAARGQRLEHLREQSSLLWGRLYDAQGNVDGEQAGELAGLMRLSDSIAKNMPVWPFGGDDFRRFSLGIAPLWTVGVYVLAEIIIPQLFSSVFG